MKVIRKTDIKTEIQSLNPNKIAVGYIGDIYKQILVQDLDSKAVITSTLFGNNKKTISNINNSDIRLGIIENLHTKLYIGEFGAIIGSANMTSFGLEPNDGNEELCVFIPSTYEAYQELNKYFDSLFSRSETNKEIIDALIASMPDAPANSPHKDSPNNFNVESTENSKSTVNNNNIQNEKVWIVPGGERGWHEYKEYNVYICSPTDGSSIRKNLLNSVSRIGFYAQSNEKGNPSEIKNCVAKVLSKKIDFTVDVKKEDKFNSILKKIIDSKYGPQCDAHRYNGQKIALFELSSENSEETIKLPSEIPNDKLDKNGELTAFTQNPVFVAVSELLRNQTTRNINLS